MDRTLKNVEVINNATYYSCACGFTAIGYRSDEGVYEDTGWYQHWGRLDPSCGNYWYINYDYYKITLKSGDKIAINTISSNPIIYAVQKDGYQISYATDGKNFTTVSFDSKITQPEKTLARISFSSVQDGTLTIRQSQSNVNGTAFTDVPGWCASAVNWAVDQGITDGVGNKKFAPGSQCTHAMILTFLWRANGKHIYSMVPSALSIEAKSPSYAAYAMRWAFVEGMIDETIDPTAPCTRADALKYIWQVFGKENAAASSFSDVPASADYAAAVNWAVANGIVEGYPDGTFRPDTICNRGVIVTMLHRAYVSSARLK